MFAQSFGNPSMMNMGEEIQLISLEIFKTRDYHDQWRRSYTCQLTGATLNNLGNLVGQMGADKAFSLLGVSQLNNMGANSGLDAGGIIRYSSSPTAAVPIANGWGTPRARFCLVVDVKKNGIPIRREEIVGYTDYYGISDMTGQAHLDPNMVYTIDSIKTEPYEMSRGIAGMQTNAGIGMSSLVLSNQSPLSNPFAGNNNATQYTMRPTDVFTVADSQELIAGAQDGFGTFNTQTGMMQLSGKNYIADAVLGSAAKTSNRKNDLPGTFASRVMTNFFQTSSTALTSAGDDFLTPATAAMMRVKENSVSDSSFAFAIRNVGGTCSVTGQFTQSELLRLDPTIDMRTQVNREGELFLGTGGIYIPPTCNTEAIGKTSHHAIIAQMVANAFLSLMSTHGMTMASAICDNYTGQARCVVNSQLGLTEHNREAMVSNFENSMAIEVLGIIASSGIGSFRIDVNADMLNQIYLQVRLNGEIQPTPFVLPAFASSAMTPIVTNDFNMITNFAEQVGSVVEGVLGTRGPAINYQIPGGSGNNGAPPMGFGGTGQATW